MEDDDEGIFKRAHVTELREGEAVYSKEKVDELIVALTMCRLFSGNANAVEGCRLIQKRSVEALEAWDKGEEK